MKIWGRHVKLLKLEPRGDGSYNASWIERRRAGRTSITEQKDAVIWPKDTNVGAERLSQIVSSLPGRFPQSGKGSVPFPPLAAADAESNKFGGGPESLRPGLTE